MQFFQRIVIVVLCLLSTKKLKAQFDQTNTILNTCTQNFNFCAGGNPQQVSQFIADDIFSDTISIGFSFPFFGTNYNSCIISPNNFISFDLGFANIQSLFYYSGALAQGQLDKAILFPFQDLDITQGGKIRYTTVGVAPNRRFVVEFCKVPYFFCATGVAQNQLVLHEGTGIIEMFIKQNLCASGWAGSNTSPVIQGLRGNGTNVFVPGRAPNNPAWSVTTSEGKRFTPNGASYTIADVAYNPIPILFPNQGTFNWYAGNSNQPFATTSCVQVNHNATVPYYRVQYSGTIGCDSLPGSLWDTVFVNYQPQYLHDTLKICERNLPYTWQGITFDINTTTQYQFDTVLVNNLGSCDQWKILSVEIQSLLTPTFNFSLNYCAQSTVSPLSPIATNGIVGTWSPAFSNQVSNTYTFTPNSNFCAAQTTAAIQIVAPLLPTFNSPATLCAGSASPLLTTATNGIQGTWTPLFDANNSGTYTFTPDSNQCSSPLTVSIAITPLEIPVFDSFPPVCLGATIAPLPLVSNNGLAGTWSPGVNNTQTTVYTFTPNAGVCALPITKEIVVNTSTTIPMFNSIGAICEGGAMMPLPTQSINGIVGSWSPALNNLNTTTYTFTPSNLQCGTATTLNVVVQPNVFPNFPSIDTLCAGATSFPFGNVSTNGIVGTWSPAFNNLLSGVYTFTPNSGQCSAPVVQSIVVKPLTVPTFASFTPICFGDVVAPLPTVSQNGIAGVWTPAIDNTLTTTYTFTPANTNPSTCATSTSMALVVNQLINPIFDLPSVLCTSSLPPNTLPTVSNNGIYGTWSPNVINPATTTYTFTPNQGQCAAVFTYNIAFVDSTTVPIFNQIGPICQGSSTAPQLPSIANNYITGTWSPAQIATAAVGTYTFTFTPDSTSCGQPTTMSIQIVNQINPLFDSIAPICQNGLNLLPNTSINGVVGTWSPAFNNQSTTTYTFTPNGGQCAVSQQKTIAIAPNLNPVFNLPSTVCQNSSIASFPTISTNGISGTWSPALNTAQTTTYTFTPSGQQCANSITHTLTVLNPISSTFNAVTPLCSGTSVNPLPLTSIEGLTGSWSPSFNNQQSQTYTFTPDTNFCALSGFVTVQIMDNTTIPTFDSFGPYCNGSQIPPLPTQSQNGITGTWSPGMQSQVTQIYTFTPASSQCGQSTSLTIVIDSIVSPIFTPAAPICLGASLNPLPTVSNNNILGNWSPSLNNNATTTYTFTPNQSTCATAASMTIVVNGPIAPLFAIDDTICHGATNSMPLPSVSSNNIVGSWSPSTINNTLTTTYNFVPNAGQCAVDTQVTIVVDTLTIPTFVQIMPHCLNWAMATLPQSSLEGVIGTWTPAVNNQQTTTYTFLPNNTQCAVDTVTMLIEIHPVITPVFTQVAPICAGQTLLPLPTISNNGVKGNWTPNINNQQTTTYTFYPLVGQCADTVQMTIIVDSLVSPLFNTVGPLCSGSSISPLPTTSLNNVLGTWSPAVNNMVTTTYTFSPSMGQCAVDTTLEIVINPSIVPFFDNFGPYCWGTAVPILPSVSNNGVAGTWNAAINNLQTNTYTFTPVSTIPCVAPISTTIIIDPLQVGYKNVTICEGQSYSFGGNVYTQSITGIADTFSNSIGCDSVIIFNLNVLPSTFGVDVNFICEGSGYTFNGNTYTTSNFTALDTLVSSAGCDSIVTLNLTVVPVQPDVQSVALSGCGAVQYGNFSFNADTLFTDTLYSQLGCDSVYRSVFIDVFPTYDVRENVSVFGCNEAYYKDVRYTQSQQLIETALSIYGCDSFTRTVNIEVHHFNLLAMVEPERPYAGELFEIRTADEFSNNYTITDWFPNSLFSNQNAYTQRLQLTSPVPIFVVGKSKTCVDTALVVVGDLPPYSGDVRIPSAFSPNGDGVNDVFKPVFRVERGYVLSEFLIFNRYGQAVYATSNVNSGWDGTFKGRLQDQGVYFYTIKIKFIDGTERNFKGDVTLIH